MRKLNEILWFRTGIDGCHGHRFVWLVDNIQSIESIRKASSGHDWFVLVKDLHLLLIKDGLTSMVAELGNADECLFHGRKQMTAGGCWFKHGEVKVAFVGGDHG